VHEKAHRVLVVEGAWRPAEREGVEIIGAEFGPVIAHGHRVELGVDADLREHRHDRLAHRLVAEKAVVGAFQPERKAVRMARLGEERARRRGVMRRPLGMRPLAFQANSRRIRLRMPADRAVTRG
jgi:hypothetical protein